MANLQTWFTTFLALPLSAGATTATLWTVPTATQGRLHIYAWSQEEWVSYTGVSGVTVTWLTRNLSQTADPATGGTWLTWIAGVPVDFVAMHDQIVDKTQSNTFATGTTQTFPDIAFTGTTTPWLKVKSLTTAQRTATSPSNWTIVYDSDAGVHYQYIWGARSTFATGTTANASTTVAGKVEIATQAEITAWTSTGWTGALLSVWPDTLKVVTDPIWNERSFWDWSDWDVTINSGTTTLTRDMYYNNLTLTSPWVLNPAWYRVFVKWTFAGTGTINRNGNAGSVWSAWTWWWGWAWWAWWTVLSQGSLNAEIAWAGWWAGWYWWVGTAWTAWTAANPSITNINWVAWAAGWAWWAWLAFAGWAAWAAWTTTRGQYYNVLFPSYLIHPAMAQSSSALLLSYKWWANSGGSGWWAWWWSGWWGWWGWSGTNWWFIWLCTRFWNFTWTITATGWAWWAWWAWHTVSPCWGWGGWSWWAWGIIFRIYKSLIADCTKTLTWWAAWAAWAWGGTWANWTIWNAGNTWETISVVI